VNEYFARQLENILRPDDEPRATEWIDEMVALIALTAKREDVDLFPRYDFMRRWFEVDHLAFTTFVSADGLHMNDWSYACLAKGLGIAIHEAATRPVLSADRHAFSD